MRATVATLLCLTLFSGCLDGGDTEPLDGADDAGESDLEPYPYHALIEFCVSEEACDFWDHHFHEVVVYELDTTELDAVVLPVPGVDPLSATRAAGNATAAWADVELLAADWFVEAFELRTYVVGQDVPSAEAVSDPEIVVVSESGQRSTSIGLNAEQIACSVVGGAVEPDPLFVPGSLATRVYPVHEHHGMAIFAAECITGGFRCVALNFASALGGNNYLYDLVAHEVGHCLGLGHVGDALDFNARYVPTTDIMSYAVNPSKVPCVSSMNARVMEGIYAELAGQEVPDWMSGRFFAMDPREYVNVDCENPEPPLICCRASQAADGPRAERVLP